MEIKEANEVVEAVVETAVKPSFNWASLGKKGLCAGVLGLAGYGLYKAIEKPAKDAFNWIAGKFKKKDNADNVAVQLSKDDGKIEVR